MNLCKRAFNRGPLPFERPVDQALRIYAARLTLLGLVVLVGVVVACASLFIAWLIGQ